MKKWLKLSFSFVVIVLVGIQFIPDQRNQIEPVTNTDFIKYYESPLDIGKMIRASCYDCHSNQTNYPWYSNVKPIGWILQNHIMEGKSELNFSEFGNQSNRMQRSKLKSILNQIDDDKMPLKSYILLHSEAKLDSLKKDSLVKYIDSLIVSIRH